MGFRTKLDYSDNRQIKQRVRTNTTLSGATVFGVSFSALTTGPDLSNQTTTETVASAISTFSGNSATTVFTWYDNRMELGATEISAITPSNSGITQNVGPIYTANTTTVIDGNSITLTYTGVSFDLQVTAMLDSGGSYTGTVEHDSVSFLSATTLDFTGRTIWVDNKEIIRTKKLIITENPQIGFVLACADSEGMLEFRPVSGVTTFSGNTFGSCINNLYVSNLYGCSPLTIHDSIQHNGSTASGPLSCAEGSGTTASGDFSHAEGSGTTASGIYSHAEGWYTRASGTSSHAEGYNTTVSGDFSHAEGGGTIASGNYSHSEGSTTIASGNYSHSEGSNGVASGPSAHAEGRNTTASGANSHAEGSATIASGTSSHAEGLAPIAGGDYSHAEGWLTIAGGTSSHAEGIYTIAGGDYSHAGGYGTGVAYKVVSNGQTSFAHFTASGATYGAYGNQSAILGGINNNINSGAHSSAILGGINNVVNTNVEGSIILGGNHMTATTSNTVYVPDLVINGLISQDPIATDASGRIVAGASDRRLKKNISSISDSLSKILSLSGVSFEYTEESNMGGGIRFGFIAQDVQNTIPELVRERAKGGGMLSLSYTEIIPWIVESIKELSSNNSPLFQKNELILQTQTIAAEDNNIELNYNGTKKSSLDGGIVVINGISENKHASFVINSDGDWITNNYIKPKGLIIPVFTPTSTNDVGGKLGEITRDDEYIYIKGNNGWGRSPLETF